MILLWNKSELLLSNFRCKIALNNSTFCNESIQKELMFSDLRIFKNLHSISYK